MFTKNTIEIKKVESKSFEVSFQSLKKATQELQELFQKEEQSIEAKIPFYLHVSKLLGDINAITNKDKLSFEDYNHIGILRKQTLSFAERSNQVNHINAFELLLESITVSIMKINDHFKLQPNQIVPADKFPINIKKEEPTFTSSIGFRKA